MMIMGNNQYIPDDNGTASGDANENEEDLKGSRFLP